MAAIYHKICCQVNSLCACVCAYCVVCLLKKICENEKKNLFFVDELCWLLFSAVKFHKIVPKLVKLMKLWAQKNIKNINRNAERKMKVKNALCV